MFVLVWFGRVFALVLVYAIVLVLFNTAMKELMILLSLNFRGRHDTTQCSLFGVVARFQIYYSMVFLVLNVLLILVHSCSDS